MVTSRLHYNQCIYSKKKKKKTHKKPETQNL